jgi:hypothetical protein
MLCCILLSSWVEGRLSTPVPVEPDPLVDPLVKVDTAASEIQRSVSKGLLRSLSFEAARGDSDI